MNVNNHNTKYPSDSHHTSNSQRHKMMGKKTLITFAISLVLLISLSTVMAQQVQAKPQTNLGPTALQQAQNQFEYRYQYCEDCSIKSEFVGDQIRVEVREQKRLFNFFNVEAVSKYELNSEGELVKTRSNIWARLLIRNQMEVA